MNSSSSDQTVIEDGSYSMKEESAPAESQDSKEGITAQMNHNGEEIAYKITYHAGQEDGEHQEQSEQQVIMDESGQQYIYQNGGGGNLYVISTVTTGEDGLQHEGQLIATSAELYEAANAAGGGQIVNISNLAELGIATNPAEMMEGQQHIIINGQQMILQNGDMIDESYANNQSFMEQEVVIDGMGVAEQEISDGSQLTNGEDVKYGQVSVSTPPYTAKKRKPARRTSGKSPANTTPAIEAGPPLIRLDPLPHTSADFNKYDDTISAVIKQSALLVEQERLEKERQLQIERIAARAAAPRRLNTPTPTPTTSTASPHNSRNTSPQEAKPPIIFLSASSSSTPNPSRGPPQISLPSSSASSTPAQAQARPPSPSQTPVQQHTVIMVKDKRKRMKFERDPMSLPFSYAGQSFNVQAQKLILNVMHFFKTHKNDEFIDSIKTPQEKAARVLNVSSSVIGKIRKNYKMGRLEHPGKKRQMTKRVLDKVNTFDEEIIRKIIKDFALRRVTPTIPMILAEARVKIGFTGSRTSFRRILHRMGYKYGKTERKIVIPDSDAADIKPSISNPGTSLTPSPSRPPTIPGLDTTVGNSMPLPKLIATSRPRIQLTPISSTAPNIRLSSLARPPNIQFTPLSRPPNIRLAPFARPTQIQVVKHETTSASSPIILNSSGNFVVNNTISSAIQQPRQIIIQHPSGSNSHQQYYAIQPQQLSQLTNNSGQQPQIIRIVNQRAPQSS